MLTNDRGFLTVSAVALSIVLLLSVGIILRPQIGVGMLLRQQLRGVEHRYARLAGVERVYAGLEKDIMLEGELVYPDLGVSVAVTETHVELQDDYILWRDVSLSTGQTCRVVNGFGVNVNQVLLIGNP